jgi:SSS family solute:Na+ symporter
VAADSGFGWSYVFWMFITAGLIGSAVWPTAVSRALAMESTQAVKRQYIWSSISFTIRLMIPYFWGIAAFVFIFSAPEGADLKVLFFPENGEPAANNLLAMPVYLGRLLPPVLIGIITAAMIAAFMSTHDSYFLCWSSVITQDVIAPLRKKPLSEQARVKLTRMIILAIGVYVFIWGLTYKGGDDIWDYMAISGAIYFNGALAVLVGGLYWKRASTAGAFSALIAGSTAIFGLGPIREAMSLDFLTSAQTGLISVGLSVTAMIAFSLLIPDRDKAASPQPNSNS